MRTGRSARHRASSTAGAAGRSRPVARARRARGHDRRRPGRRSGAPSSSPRRRPAAGRRSTSSPGADEHAQHVARHRRDERSGGERGRRVGVAGEQRERHVAVVGVDVAAVAVAPDAEAASHAVDLEHDLVGRRRRRRRRAARRRRGRVRRARAGSVTADRRLAVGQLDDAGRRPGCCASPTGCSASTARGGAGWRPARPAPRRPRRAARRRRSASVHGCSSRNPVCRSPAGNAGWREDVEQLVAVGHRAVQPGPAERVDQRADGDVPGRRRGR